VNDATDRGDTSDLPLHELDDERDREELRQRHYGLLQELRVLQPGVQVLVAFLLTAPFASRFDDLDDLGRAAYAVSLMTSMLAVVAFTAPSVLHRVAPRRARRQRLQWGLRMTRLGVVFMACALLSALFAVSRMVFGRTEALIAVSVVGGGMVVAWLVVPGTIRASERDRTR
jgi:amino acid transporter